MGLVLLLGSLEIVYAQRLCLGIGVNATERTMVRTRYNEIVSNNPNAFYVIEVANYFNYPALFVSGKYLLNDRDNFQFNLSAGDPYQWWIKLLAPTSTPSSARGYVVLGEAGVIGEFLYQRNIKVNNSCTRNGFFYVVGSRIFVTPYYSSEPLSTGFLGGNVDNPVLLPVKVASYSANPIVPMLQLGFGKRINITKNFFGEFLLYGNVGFIKIRELKVSKNNSAYKPWVSNYGNSLGIRFQLYWHKAGK